MRFPPIYIIAIVMTVAVLAVTVDSIMDGSAERTEQPEVITGSDFPAIQINNPQWGGIEVRNFDGMEVIYEAVPTEGHVFVAWLDEDGRAISNADTISSVTIAGRTITAEFAVGESGGSTTTYSWMMPVYEGNSVSYHEETFTLFISDSQYEKAHSADYHRRAVSGNVYLTPWELCIEDPAVTAIVDYLEGKTVGMTDLQKANLILKFVQGSVEYRTDSKLYGTEEWWATPLETMYNRAGDCEDTSILFCSVAAKMGMDCGLVGFSYSDPVRSTYGHMGAAVRLGIVPPEGASTFTNNAGTYFFCETTNDDDLGVLRYNQSLGVYLINDGTWTRIGYSDGSYTHEITVSIGTNYTTSSGGIYGSSFDEPPTVPLSVGDSFTYRPMTNLPSVFTATGDGLASEGGFLTFDGTTLTGTVSETGDYTVVIEAVWESGDLRQVSHQRVTFHVTGAEEVSESKVLSYSSGGWTIQSEQGEDAGDDDGDTVRLIVCAMAVLAAVIIVVQRFRA